MEDGDVAPFVHRVFALSLRGELHGRRGENHGATYGGADGVKAIDINFR